MGKGAGQFLGGALGAVSPALGVGLGIADAISSAKEKSNARDTAKHYQRQPLTNIANGLQVSTLGSDLQREEASRLASGQLSALQDSGVRGIIGGSGKVEAGNQKIMASTGADLDMQQKQIDQIRAEDQARIRGMQENREQNDLNALSSQYQSGKQDQNMAYGNIIQGTGMLGGALGGYGKQGDSVYPTAGNYSTSGYVTDMTNPNYQSPASEQKNTANTYGNFFSRNPYTPSQNMGYPSWYNDVNNKFANVNKIY